MDDLCIEMDLEIAFFFLLFHTATLFLSRDEIFLYYSFNKWHMNLKVPTVL